MTTASSRGGKSNRERWRGSLKLLLFFLAFTYVLVIQGTDLDGLDFGIQTAYVRFFQLQQTSRLQIQTSGLSEILVYLSFSSDKP